MYDLLMYYQTFLVCHLMATYITTVLFIVIFMNIAVMYFHNSGISICCLILRIVTGTGRYVYLINAALGLII